MAKVYVEEFLFRGRCPECEPGKKGDYHVVLAEFVKAPDGSTTVVRSKPMTPAQADDAGFNLSKIVSSVLAQMSRDLEAAKADRESLKERYEAELAKRTRALELSNTQAAEIVHERDMVRYQLQSALARIAELNEPPKKRSLVNILTLGALDK